MKKLLTASIALLACLGLNHNANAETIIDFSDFSSSSGYSLLGSAQKSANSLALVSSSSNAVGGVFFNTPVSVSNFSANFTFTFSDSGAGDGMMFVIKNPDSSGSDSGLGGYGEQLGYATRYSVTGIDNSVGIEFDSHYNTTAGVTNDINANHIGINTSASVISLAQTAVTPDFNSANPWYAWVDYDGTTLSVSVNQTGEKPTTAMLSYGTSDNPFVISDYTGSSALVGFTASTGGATQTTTLTSFGYSSTPDIEAVPEPSTLALLATGAFVVGLASRKKAHQIPA